MKFKKIIASLGVIALLPNIAATLVVSAGSNVASDGVSVGSAGKPSSTVGYDWGMSLEKVTLPNGSSPWDTEQEELPESVRNSSSGEVPGVEDMSGDTLTSIVGMSVTVLYTQDPKILEEIKTFCDPDGDGTQDKGTADWMREPSNREKLQVWEAYSNSTGMSYPQKCLYQLGNYTPSVLCNDFYPIGVGKTKNAFDTQQYVSCDGNNFIFNGGKFKQPNGYSGYILSDSYGGSSLSNLWNSNMWEVSASSAKFKGEDEEVIKNIWGSVCDSTETAEAIFKDLMQKKFGGSLPNNVDTSNFFFALYIEPLVQVRLSYNTGANRVWSNTVSFTPTMMAEYAKFSKGSVNISSKGLYSWTNPNNFINRVLMSTGTHATSGTATLADVDSFTSGNAISRANEIGLENLVCGYGRGAYEVGYLKGGDLALDDLPNMPSVPVIHDRNSYDVEKNKPDSLASLAGAENAIYDGCATIDQTTWNEITEILSYALHLTDTEPSSDNPLLTDRVLDSIEATRKVSLKAVDTKGATKADTVYNPEYLKSYKRLLNALAATSRLSGSYIESGTREECDCNYSNTVEFYKRSKNNDPDDYFDKSDDSNFTRLGFGTTTSDMGKQEGKLSVNYSDIVMCHTELGSGSNTNYDIAHGTQDDDSNYIMGNATIQDSDGKVSYGELLKYPYSYCIKYRNYSAPLESSAFGEPTRPNVVIFDEDTGETWDATISDEIWNNVKQLSGFMYAKDGYNNLPGSPSGTSNSYEELARKARENRETINRIAPYIEGYRKAIDILDRYVDENGNVRDNGNKLKSVDNLANELGCDFEVLFEDNDDGGYSYSTSWFTDYDAMWDFMNNDVNGVVTNNAREISNLISGSGLTDMHGLITDNNYILSSAANSVERTLSDDCVGNHIGDCIWRTCDGAEWDSEQTRSNFHWDNGEICWSNVGIRYSNSGFCYCIQKHLDYWSARIIWNLEDIFRAYYNTQSNAFKELRNDIQREISSYEDAINNFPRNYAEAYNAYADTYSDSWLVALDESSTSNSITKNDMTADLKLRRTVMKESVPYYTDADKNSASSAYMQAIMDVVLNDRSTSGLRDNEYYYNLYNLYDSNSYENPVVYIARKPDSKDVSEMFVSDLKGYYLEMENVSGNPGANTITSELENPYKVRVVNNITGNPNSNYTGIYKTGIALTRSTIPELVSAPCWKDLSVASVLKDPYHYGIIINGWVKHSTDGVVYPWQQSKWQVDTSNDFTRLTRYILTNKSLRVWDGESGGSKYWLSSIDGDSNTSVFYNSYLNRDVANSLIGSAFRDHPTVVTSDDSTSNTENADGYHVRWKGLSKVDELMYLTTRDAAAGYAPSIINHQHTPTYSGFSEVSVNGVSSISKSEYLMFDSDGNQSDAYNKTGEITLDSRIDGTTRMFKMYISRATADNTTSADEIDLCKTDVEYKYFDDLESNSAEIKGKSIAEYNANDGTFVDLWGNQGDVHSRQAFGMTASIGDEPDVAAILDRDAYPFITSTRNGKTVNTPYVTSPAFNFLWVNAKTDHSIKTDFNIQMKYNSKIILNTSYSTDAEDIEVMKDIPFIKAGQTIELRTEGIDTKESYIEVEASCVVPASNSKIRRPDNQNCKFNSAEDFNNAMKAYCEFIANNAKIGIGSTFNGVNTTGSEGSKIAKSPLSIDMFSKYNVDEKEPGSITSTYFNSDRVDPNGNAMEVVDVEYNEINLEPSSIVWSAGSTPSNSYTDGYTGLAQNALNSILYPSTTTSSTPCPIWYKEYTDQYSVATFSAKIKINMNEFTAIISKYESDSLTESDSLLHKNNDSIAKAWRNNNVFGYKVQLQRVEDDYANSFIPFIDLSECKNGNTIADILGNSISTQGVTLKEIPTYLVGEQTSVHVRGSIYDNT